MPIRILDSPEPFSPVTLTGDDGLSGEECVLMEADAYRLLCAEVRRYCERKTSGRSILIAGHRGAGKTTLALHAILSEVRYAKYRRGMLRPLLIPLLGPNLLPDTPAGNTLPPTKPAVAPAATPAESQPATGTVPQSVASAATMAGATPIAASTSEKLPAPQPQTGEADEKPEKPVDRPGLDDDIRNALVQIILGLHRALVREVCHRLRRQIHLRNSANDTAELLELAAQVEIELDEEPSPMRLRDLWHRLGVLEGGVLHDDEPPGQGLRELVALTNVCEAFQRISAEITQETNSGAEASDEGSVGVAADTKQEAWFGPIASLLTGGVVGAAIAAAGETGPAAALGGAIASLGAAVTLKASWSRTRKVTQSRTRTLVRNLKIDTLDRVVPVLIERMIAAGLAPVFVVDELDKVADHARITAMAKRLKKLVAENAFFCFLVDRAYFELLNYCTSQGAYPIEYTSYTHQLFVIYRPHDFHDYLRRILIKPDEPSEPLPDLMPPVPRPDDEATTTSNAGAPVSLSADAAARNMYKEDLADLSVLPYVLLAQSRMHPIDMRRRLDGFRASDGTIGFDRGYVRTLWMYRFQAFVQVAVEIVLAGKEMTAEFEHDPAFRRIAYDALYWIPRQWPDVRTDGLDLSAAKLDDFRNAMLKRGGADASLDDERTRFLYRQVQRLAELLSDLNTFEQELAKFQPNPPLHQDVKDALPKLPEPGPLLRLRAGALGVYEWCYTTSGRPIPAQPTVSLHKAPAIDVPPAWIAAAARIEDTARNLRSIGNDEWDLTTLSSTWHVLPTSPAWSQAAPAIERLRESERRNARHEGYDEDASNVEHFARVLDESNDALMLALYCGAAIGSLAMEGPLSRRIRHGLDAIAVTLLFEGKDVRAVTQSLFELAERCRSGHPAALEPPLGVERWDAFTNVLRELGDVPFDAARFADMRRQAWSTVGPRLLRSTNLLDEPPGRSVAEIVTAAAAAGGNLNWVLSLPLRTMTLVKWSRALLLSIRAADDSNESTHVPSWVVLLALKHLGVHADLPTVLGGRADADWTAWYERGRGGVKPAAVFVMSSPKSPAEAWLPSDDHGMLVIAHDDLREFRPQLTQLLKSLAAAKQRFDFIVVEVLPHVTNLQPVTEPLVGLFDIDDVRLTLRGEASREIEGSGFPIVPNGRTVADIFLPPVLPRVTRTRKKKAPPSEPA